MLQPASDTLHLVGTVACAPDVATNQSSFIRAMTVIDLGGAKYVVVRAYSPAGVANPLLGLAPGCGVSVFGHLSPVDVASQDGTGDYVSMGAFPGVPPLALEIVADDVLLLTAPPAPPQPQAAMASVPTPPLHTEQPPAASPDSRLADVPEPPEDGGSGGIALGDSVPF